MGVAPMDLDVMRYAGSATSPFQGNVQFDRHPTYWLGAGFLILREYSAPSSMAQSRTREAQPSQSDGLFGMDVIGGLFGMSGSFGGGDQSCLNHRDSLGYQPCKLTQ